ncbi:MAG: PTS transporter subunit EIIA [Xanthomonadales bacterium]|nr:PTS sugar transporter subunit IIA [Gammaproteobacteria bacterium]MBT8053062.1 PTS sugar transporter subunit IIA [Gammaproteobacteria bacterium]NND56694.1 PTS transporter subunit EIIA [Xanthomonadales bacterium]NNK52679.1 PTS transporter subunit EIIA [Xanthomonadales bacterium]
MFISDLLTLEKVHCDVHSSSKKRLLELISEELARNSEQFSQREVFESLCARERLGSTGLGKGVAIPHGRVKGTDSVEVSFFRLKKPLPFDATDGEPVDLLFALAVPESCGEDHLRLLAQVAELFSDPEILVELRTAEDAAGLLKLLSSAGH